MDASELQHEFFQMIKLGMPPGSSAIDEIAKVLDVSVDSVYRRMRGEKTISLEELYKLSSHYKISLDQLMDLQTGTFQFRGNFLNEKTFRYDNYMNGMIRDLSYMNSFKNREVYNLCKDVPFFNHFIFVSLSLSGVQSKSLVFKMADSKVSSNFFSLHYCISQ